LQDSEQAHKLNLTLNFMERTLRIQVQNFVHSKEFFAKCFCSTVPSDAVCLPVSDKSPVKNAVGFCCLHHSHSVSHALF
jgi:hypothetical protein